MSTATGTAAVGPAKTASRAKHYMRILMLLIALTLPLLSLAVLGSVWLWQNGYLLAWALGALIATTAAFSIERWLLRDAFASASSAADGGMGIGVSATAFSDKREMAAWQAVQALADETPPQTIDSRDALIDLGKRTVETVARQMHPEDKDPVLKFTVPEMLILIERVSGKLAPFVRENVPLGDRLTVSQFLAIYRWRGVLDFADKAYDIWRIVRIMNPATAVANELREKVTRQLYDWGRKELARRMTTAYIREVGRASIDLYSGRLRGNEMRATQVPPDASSPDASANPTAALPEVAGNEQADSKEGTPRKRGRLAAVGRIFKQTGNAAKLLWRRRND